MTHPSLTRRMSGIVAMVAGGLLLLTALTPQGALAHERFNVGKYQFVIGWIVEPPIVGIKNSLDLGIYDVTNVSSPRAILNAQNNLTVKFLYGSQVFPVGLVPAFRNPGKYVGDIIPTAAGTYRVNFTGRVESQRVNFTQALDDVAWPTALEFPNPRPTPENISKVANGAQLTATYSLILGGGGVILGAAGLAVAFLSRRKHREG